MKRILMMLAVLSLILCLSACSDGKDISEKVYAQTENGNLQTVSEDEKFSENKIDMSVSTNKNTENTSETVSENGSKILVAFFSRADENYGVGVIEKGNTRIIADMIAEELNADIFEISRITPYPTAYDECTDEAQEEKTKNARPELTEEIENFDDYDIIFLGYPIWLAYHNLIQCTQRG